MNKLATLALSRKVGGISSWNDLADKPFGDETVPTITFDGNLEGKEAVYAGETAMTGVSMVFVRMMDYVPKEKLLGGVAICHNVAYPDHDQEYVFEENMLIPASSFGIDDPLSYGAEISTMPGAICMHSDGRILMSNGIITADCYLRAGLWIMCAVENDAPCIYVTKAIFPEKVKPLDEKYMPLLTSPSGKKFKLTVDDTGAISATEVV